MGNYFRAHHLRNICNVWKHFRYEKVKTMQNYVGQQIDRYRITERLGMGGMAVVYKAYDTRLERDVAIKFIRTGEIPESQHERLFKRFEREAKSQARFSHRNIIPVFDYGEVDGSPYLVMAFISGGTLKDRLHGPVDWRQAVRWLIPVAEALSYAHQHGIVHRDVKPGNILFDKEDQPILTDFGIAKVLETDEATLTGTGLGVGTPEYMAPEQWQGKTSAATDQYALGVVLYELITGRKPYAADTPAAVAIMQATEPLSPPSKIVSGIPERVEKVLYKALARNPEDRYENMGEFALALRGLMAEAETAEPILPQKDTQKQEPTYAPQASSSSEGITRDALDATPVEAMETASKSKRELPKWVPWAGLGIIGLAIIGLAIGIGGNLVDLGKGGEGPLAMLATETATATATVTPTVTKTATPTKTATVTPTPEPTLGVGSTLVNEKDGAEMVYVPAGEFLMGSSDEDINWILEQSWCSNCERDWFLNEQPEHDVYLDKYWIYKYEVTNTQFAAFLNAEGNQGEGIFTWFTEIPGQGKIQLQGSDWVVDSGYADHPVVSVNWYGAQAYCEWAGGRLPTEAEWEKAAKGADGRIFSWGDTDITGLKANYCDVNCDLSWKDSNQDDGYKKTAPVGSFSAGASPYGALNMAGNVWEWVADLYVEDYYISSPLTNPTGPGSGNDRVLRGGSWYFGVISLHASSRDGADPINSWDFAGFRCVSSP